MLQKNSWGFLYRRLIQLSQKDEAHKKNYILKEIRTHINLSKATKIWKKEGYYLSENILQFDYVTFFIGELKRRKVKEKAN